MLDGVLATSVQAGVRRPHVADAEVEYTTRRVRSVQHPESVGVLREDATIPVQNAVSVAVELAVSPDHAAVVMHRLASQYYGGSDMNMPYLPWK